MIEITGLWEKKDKNGNPFFVGKLGRADVLIFKNTHKKEDKHPDYRVYVGEKKEEGARKDSTPSFSDNKEIPF